MSDALEKALEMIEMDSGTARRGKRVPKERRPRGFLIQIGMSDEDDDVREQGGVGTEASEDAHTMHGEDSEINPGSSDDEGEPGVVFRRRR